ncbi:hypothetical protein P3T36_003413 [Kitasatospora sp. MAP12-15]|uniref:hypothetical protein n=1 Tax=unclassified Kitasatospora TaxID=2633591 RepID=UPI002476B1EA|nr:hypothetical protein [Kitasatospora sp. MAP12-44]MDH6110376.1 hypothetical protein [Kitasatospora sp. MAP12-44]
MDFADIELSWLTQTLPPQVIGSEPEAEGVRPLLARGGRFDRYTQVVRTIDRLSLFVNRSSFRLLVDSDAAVLVGGSRSPLGARPY